MRTLAALFLVTAVASAEDRVLTVTGTATVYVKPDTARIHYGVKVSEPTTDAVKDVLTKTNTAIDDAVKKLKMPNVKVTVGPMSLKQTSTNPGGGGIAIAPGGAAAPAAPGTGPFTGSIGQCATITESDPEKLRAGVDAYLKAVVEGGANTAGGDDSKEDNANFVFPGQQSSSGPKVVLSRSDESAGRDEALQQAVARAMKNAKAIAKGLGATADPTVLSVTEGTPEAPPAGKSIETFIDLYSSGGDPAPKVPAGEIEVRVKVVVRCKY